jgi:prepilin-type N-terminal cleavage/methylation domain-containing protein
MKTLRINHRNAGFTLIETLVSLLIFSLVTAAMMPAFMSQLKYSHQSKVKTGALSAAQQALDAVRVVNPETLPTGGATTTSTVTAGDYTYSVVLTYCNPDTYCSARSRFITAEVSYQGTELYEVSTVFTRLR